MASAATDQDPGRWYQNILIPIRHGKASDASVEASTDGHYIRLCLTEGPANNVRAWIGKNMQANPQVDFYDFELLANTNYDIKIVSRPTSFDLHVGGVLVKTVTGLDEVTDGLIGFGGNGARGAFPAEQQTFTISNLSLIDMTPPVVPDPQPSVDPDPVDGQLIPNPNPDQPLPSEITYNAADKSFLVAANTDAKVFLNTKKAILAADKSYVYELTVKIADVSGGGHIYIPIRHANTTIPQNEDDLRGGHYIAMWFDEPNRIRMGADLRTFEYGGTPFAFEDVPFEANKDYNFKIISSPTKMDVYLNGTLVKSLTGLTPVAGVVGFGSNANTKAYTVKNISLKEYADPGPTIPEDEGNEPDDNDNNGGNNNGGDNSGGNPSAGQSAGIFVGVVFLASVASAIVLKKRRIKA